CLCGAWLLTTVVLAEEPRSMVRFGAWPNPQWVKARPAGKGLRVISFNCAGGSRAAADEVIPLKPDIVLLQESPSKENVEELARRLWGSSDCALAGPDASVLADGKLTEEEAPAELRSYAVMARAKLRMGTELELVSMRLTPAQVRDDL